MIDYQFLLNRKEKSCTLAELGTIFLIFGASIIWLFVWKKRWAPEGLLDKSSLGNKRDLSIAFLIQPAMLAQASGQGSTVFDYTTNENTNSSY